jgi:hypothetical protein
MKMTCQDIKNSLYYGDNLEVLRHYIKEESIYLIYLDPPFKSNQNYNVLFIEQNGSRSKAQVNAFEDKVKYKVIGEPKDIAGAKNLAKDNPYQFQFWAVDKVGARPTEQKKGADKGIDGRIYFHDEDEIGKTKQIILSVKSGHTGPDHIRDLRGVIEREEAVIGVLITLKSPTKEMRAEAASAGFYESPSWNARYSRLQILTIEDIFGGKEIACPPLKYVSKTFKKAPKAKEKVNMHQQLIDKGMEKYD